MLMVLCLLPTFPAKAQTTRTESFTYTENFSSVSDNTLPNGYFMVKQAASGSMAVSGGALVMDGTSSTSGRNVMSLPVAYRYATDFVFEADVTITSVVNDSRWVSLAYRIQGQDDPLYFQMAVRKNATADSGVELAEWTPNDWVVHNRASYKENLSLNRTYRLKVEATGSTVREYIDGTLLIEKTDVPYQNGGFGLGVAGCVARFDNIKLTGTMVVPMTDDGYYFKDDFSGHPQGGWDGAYHLGECQPYATVGMADGAMQIDTTNDQASSAGRTTIFLPDSLNFIQDFVLEADLKILSVKSGDGSRWGSVIYRAVENGKTGQTERNRPYMQMAVRRDAAASNGVEVARMTSDFSVLSRGAFTENLDSGRFYHLKVMAVGDRVIEYINDRKMIDCSSVPAERGTFGISAAGAKIQVDNITIAPCSADQMPEQLGSGYATDIYEPATSIVAAPTTVWLSDKTLSQVIGSTKRPATVVAYVDESGQVWSMDRTASFGSLKDFTLTLNMRALPAYCIDTAEAATLLSDFLNEYNIVDAFVWSKNPSLVTAVRIACPYVKGVVEFDIADDLVTVMSTTNSAKAKIAVIPEAYANADFVRKLQHRFMTIWVKTAGRDASVYTQINIGASGIVTENYRQVIDALESYSGTTLVRNPSIIGHRGMPQGTLNENTISSYRAAYEAGANALETDVYLTTDNELVIMHDPDVGRTTNGSGDIRDKTLAQVKALTMRYNSSEHVPALRDMFQEFKGKNVVLVVELKYNQEGIVPALKRLLDEFDMYDQVVIITFFDYQMGRMEELLPGVSRGYLNMALPGAYNAQQDMEYVFSICAKGTWTCNPNYNSTANSVYIEAAKHRGMTSWPWTYNAQSELDKYYMLGLNGLTTNYAKQATNYTSRLQLVGQDAVITTGDTVSAYAQTISQKGIVSNDYAAELVRLSGNLTLTGGNGTYAPSGEGHGVFCFRKDVSLGSGQHYWLYSEAFEVNCYNSTQILSYAAKEAQDRYDVRAQVISRDNASKSLRMIAGTYDQDGRLLSASVYEEVMEPNSLQTFSEEKTREADAAYVTLYIWNEWMMCMEPFGANSKWSNQD